MPEQLLQFVPHDQVEAFKADGWTVSDDMRGTHHGNYSVIMVKPTTEAE